ncbi:MAG TPA: potassium channel family protein [Solirubrobacterales bacterium]|nr:potassium channel family protein [Solirubrobacterales bacterium]
MDVVWTLLGIALIALALRDIFDVLFHPLGRGMVARRVVRGVAWMARRLSGRGGTVGLLAGPLGYIVVVATWAALLAVGWALIFYPQLPDGFNFDRPLDPAQHAGFLDALYISLVNLTSLGYGDISPAAPLLRLLGPIETMFGLGLLTASISWLISIYNAISRRDSLAHEVHLAKEAEERLGEKLADADPELLEGLLASFAEQLIRARRDVIHFPIVHFFRTEDEERALAGLLPFLSSLAEEAGEDGRPHALRVRAEILRMAIDDFAETLRVRLQMPGDTTGATLKHYQSEHRPLGSR